MKGNFTNSGIQIILNFYLFEFRLLGNFKHSYCYFINQNHLIFFFLVNKHMIIIFGAQDWKSQDGISSFMMANMSFLDYNLVFI